jgi:UDP-N-acetylglucosamine--N-acetylmuramyl-(pentapeptide) pyrophosphoryl-undecaprenol N-acetylglucosamine transferase
MSNIAFVAGHSGGHIIPCLTIALHTKQADPSSRILFIATDAKLDRTVIGNNPTIDKQLLLDIEQVPYRRPWRLPFFSYKFIRAIIASIRALRREKTEQVITTGGFIAIPTCIAARLLRIPIELFELNVIPGKTVKFLAPLAQSIKIVFPQTATYFPKKSCAVTPYPVRFATAPFNREEWIAKLGFDTNRRTIFVLGGSQGSQALNRLINSWVHNNPKFHDQVQIIHQVGQTSAIQAQITRYKQCSIPSFVFSYSDQVAPLYQLADLVITRAGSGTLAELQLFKTRTIIIPLETSLTDHQLHNAHAVQELAPQQFTVLRQTDVDKSPSLLFDQLRSIFQTYEPLKDCSLEAVPNQL